MSKTGRNEACPCGSGKKFKLCHGSTGFEAIVARAAQEAQKQGIQQLQRERQQGKGRPIVSFEQVDQRVIVVGHRLRRGSWKTFPDFLHDYIKSTLGSAWGQMEIAKPPCDQHPIIQWYQSLCHLQTEYNKAPGEVSAMPMFGVARAYLGLAYDLYTLEHNEESTPDPDVGQRLLQRLRHPDQFVGARYELRIAALFLRAGFILRWEDETVGETTHGEFTATFPPTGAQFWVECKIRQPSRQKESGRGLGRFSGLVVDALQKVTNMQRFIFVDLNTPAKPRLDADKSDWRDWAIGRLRLLEGSPTGRDLPPALVMVTNYPDHHHLTTLIPDAGGAIEGFKMPDYRTGQIMPLREAIERRSLHPEVNALMASMSEHHDIPSTFGGEIPELEGTSDRLVLGQRYEVELGKVGTLMDACVMESQQHVAAFLKFEDGTQALYNIPLSDMELAAWRRYPETFFGELRQPPHTSKSALDLYDFFLASFMSTSREDLLAQAVGRSDFAELERLSQGELAKVRAEHMAEGAARMSGGFPIPTWVRRLRPPPVRAS